MPPTLKVSISIITGRGGEKFILSCLDSICKTYKGLMKIFVTSNLASPEIINKIKRQFPRVHLIINKEKKGFAENHNNVIEMTDGEYILILNDDTVIRDNAIEKLINYMDEHSDVAAISPKLLNPDLSLQQSTYGFPNLFTNTLNLLGIRKLIPFNKFTYKLVSTFCKDGQSRFWEHNKICEIDTLRGACVLMKRKAIKDVGLMDEICLAYGEETEWHYRFKKKGWKIIFYPEAEIIHYGQQTTKDEKFILKEKIKGILNFYKKHKSKFSYYFLRTIIIFIFFFQSFFSLMAMQKKIAESYFEIIKIALDPEKSFRGKRIFY